MKLSAFNLRSRTVASLVVMSLLDSRARAQGVAAKPAEAKPATAQTPTPAASDAKIAGQDVPVPGRKKYVAPEYPLAAATEGIRGIVILEVLISEEGIVLDARVTRSIPGLDDAAVTAVKGWQYEPTKLAGKPVKVLLSQSITFALKLPDLQRASGIPELKSGGAPSVPSGVTSAESASIAVTLGSLGEVHEASAVDGNQALSDALLRAVKSWRFVVPDGAPPQSFTVRADWSPGPPPALVLKALDSKNAVAAPMAPITADKPASVAPTSATTPSSPAQTASTVTLPAATPSPAPMGTPSVATDVIPAREEPPAKEQGISTISDVTLGENIPDLVRGRRPVWPPLARLGNITGEVIVRFSVDLAGKVTVHSAEGPAMLKDGAEQAVGTWLFRRTAIDRIHLVATFKFANERSSAKVERQP